MRRPVKVSPEPAEVVELRQKHDREVYDLRVELQRMRETAHDVSHRAMLYREDGQMLLGIVARYHRAIRSLGWGAPDDELALVEKIRKDLEQ